MQGRWEVQGRFQLKTLVQALEQITQIAPSMSLEVFKTYLDQPDLRGAELGHRPYWSSNLNYSVEIRAA